VKPQHSSGLLRNRRAAAVIWKLLKKIGEWLQGKERAPANNRNVLKRT
jgi:hypothetical protein